MKKARLAGLAAGALALALTGVGATTVSASAEPLPADYSGSTHGDMVDLSVSALSTLLPIEELAGATIGHSATSTDSTAAPATTAESANLELGLADQGIPVDANGAQAPPSSTYDGGLNQDGDLDQVDIPGLLDTGLINGSGQANFVSTTECVAPGTPLTESTTSLASVDLGITSGILPPELVGPLGSIASIGAIETGGTTYLDGTSVVSEQTATLADISLLGGLAVVQVDSPVTLTATSTGAGEGDLAYSNPTASIDLGGGNVVDVALDGTTTTEQLTIDAGASGSLVIDLSVALAPAPTDGTAGAGVSADVPNVLSIDLSISAEGVLLQALIGSDIADISLSVSPMSVSATAPTGGVECDVDDSNDDGVPVDGADPGTDPGTDPDTPGTDDGGNEFDGDGLSDSEENTEGTTPLDGSEDMADSGAGGDSVGAGNDSGGAGGTTGDAVLPATGGPAGMVLLLLLGLASLGGGVWLLCRRTALI